MGKGGGGGGNTVSRVEPSELVAPYIRDLLPGFEQAFQDRLANPQSAGPSAIPGFDPLQQASQNLALNFATGGGLTQGINSAGNALNFALDLPQNIGNNPAVQNQVQAAQRSLVDNFQNTIMPGITDQAIGAGGLGGSRQGVAQGLASQGLLNELGDVSSNIIGDAFSSSLENQQRALALAPSTLGLGGMPAQLIGDIGAQRQAMTAAQLAEQRGDFQAQQAMNDPMNITRDFLNTLIAPGFGSSTSQMTSGQSPNRLASGIGGAVAGGLAGNALSAGTFLGAGPAAALGPAGLALALLGGGLGLFG